MFIKICRKCKTKMYNPARGEWKTIARYIVDEAIAKEVPIKWTNCPYCKIAEDILRKAETERENSIWS